MNSAPNPPRITTKAKISPGLPAAGSDSPSLRSSEGTTDSGEAVAGRVGVAVSEGKGEAVTVGVSEGAGVAGWRPGDAVTSDGVVGCGVKVAGSVGVGGSAVDVAAMGGVGEDGTGVAGAARAAVGRVSGVEEGATPGWVAPAQMLSNVTAGGNPDPSPHIQASTSPGFNVRAAAPSVA